MSEPKDFLSRWSQRKLNPEKAKPAPAEKQAALPSAKSVRAEPEFDITKLPPLESIGANSDITAFLQRGVPAALTRAALRRAWSADPAIRDFVGLSENSWDFNKPDSLPGFGSLDSSEVRRLTAHFFSESPAGGGPEDEARTTVPQVSPAASDSARREKPATQPAPAPSAVRRGEHGPRHGDPAAALGSKADSSAKSETPSTDVAAQQDEGEKHPRLARRHGGALPK